MLKEKKLVVMVVEDDKLLLDTILQMMEAKSFEVIPYDNGTMALNTLKKGDINLDAIWLDYYLGDMDCTELLKFAKSSKKYAKIPVVVVSNSADDEVVQKVMDLGANKCLLKAEYRMQDIIDMLIDLIK